MAAPRSDADTSAWFEHVLHSRCDYRELLSIDTDDFLQHNKLTWNMASPVTGQIPLTQWLEQLLVDSMHREHIAANMSTKSDPWFKAVRIWASELIRIQIRLSAWLLPKFSGFIPSLALLNWFGSRSDCLLDCSQNLVDSFHHWHQSFCWVPWKAASDCMRNSNKSPKVPYSVKLREDTKRSGMCMKHWITPKVNSLFPLVGTITTISFNKIGWLVLILLTDKHTNQQHWLLEMSSD